MKFNNTFSRERFTMLFRSSFLINRKLITITLAGVAGTFFVSLLLLQKLTGFSNWHQQGYLATFLVFFLLLGAVYSSLSFPSFRSGVKSVNYLMLPASTFEKFLFELTTRVLAFIIIMPLLFWVVANLEARIVFHYRPDLGRPDFSFIDGWNNFFNFKKMTGWIILLIVNLLIMVFTSIFAGAAYFTKSPLVKTLFTVTIIAVFFSFYIWLLLKAFDIMHYSPAGSRVLFINNETQAQAFFALGSSAVNIIIIIMSWFFLKEKEA
jgi:hypothetical protein